MPFHSDHRPQASSQYFWIQKGTPLYTANRLQRWATTLLDYNFTIKYYWTDIIGHDDALSRLVTNTNKGPKDSVITVVSLELETTSAFAFSVRALLVTWSVKLQLLIQCYKKWCISIVQNVQKVCTDKNSTFLSASSFIVRSWWMSSFCWARDCLILITRQSDQIIPLWSSMY